MYTPLITIAAMVAVGILFVLAPVAIDTYRRCRNRKVLICPENHNSAEVELKAGRAGLMSALGKSKLAVEMVQPLAAQERMRGTVRER